MVITEGIAVSTSEQDEVRRIVEAFERSDWEHIDVRSAGVRVHLSSTVPAHTPGSEVDGDVPLVTAVADTARTETLTSEPTGSETDAVAAPDVPSDAHIITSPPPGIFWRAPEPGAPPFTSIVAVIDPSSTLAIIEVMKLMSHLKAGVSGEVIAIFVEDGVVVGKDEPLLAVVVA